MGNDEVYTAGFPNAQRLDLDGLKGRFFSSSYTPGFGTVEYELRIMELEALFEKTNKDGFIDFLYTTRLFLGK
jgi:hypothetical protein